MAAEQHSHEEWKPTYTPFSANLFDVVHTRDGPYAVGASGTVVADRGEGWEVLVDAGPAAKNSKLRAVEATDDGKRIWFVGASGAIGMYDVVAQKKYDYSYSGNITNSWRSVSLYGAAGTEKGLIGNGAGAVLPFVVDGQDVTWGQPTKPGQGSAIAGLATTTKGTSYAVDTAGKTYTAKATEKQWTRLGSLDAQVAFNDVYADAEGRVYVAAGNGRLYRYDQGAGQWTPVSVASVSLRDVELESGSVYVLDANNVVHHRPVGSGHAWRQASPPVGNDLLALAMGYPDVAVGKAGTVVERPPEQKPPEGEAPHRDPKQRVETILTCEDVVQELLTRLSREELVALIEERTGCNPALLHHLTESGAATELRELVAAEQEPVVMLPVEADALTGRVAERERVETGRGQRRRVATGRDCTCECEELDVGVEELVRLLE